MKILYTFIAVLFSTAMMAQAYNGKGDIKFQVGANIQDNGTGITSSLDFGLGENISVGALATYLLGVEELLNAEFEDRIDFQGRFNAHLSNVLNIDQNFDLYPGLHLGLRNFGGHLGARYFFAPGFGVFTEFSVPFAEYKSENLTPAETLNNQFNFVIGASFNL